MFDDAAAKTIKRMRGRGGRKLKSKPKTLAAAAKRLRTEKSGKVKRRKPK